MFLKCPQRQPRDYMDLKMTLKYLTSLLTNNCVNIDYGNGKTNETQITCLTLLKLTPRVDINCIIVTACKKLGDERNRETGERTDRFVRETLAPREGQVLVAQNHAKTWLSFISTLVIRLLFLPRVTNTHMWRLHRSYIALHHRCKLCHAVLHSIAN